MARGRHGEAIPERNAHRHRCPLQPGSLSALCSERRSSSCVILIDRFVRSSPPNSISHRSLRTAGERPERVVEPAVRQSLGQFRSPVPSRRSGHSVPPVDVKPMERPAPAWVEPEDIDRAPVPASYTDETLRTYLPDWALTPIPARVEGPSSRSVGCPCVSQPSFPRCAWLSTRPRARSRLPTRGRF